jgi:hypothetical protein
LISVRDLGKELALAEVEVEESQRLKRVKEIDLHQLKIKRNNLVQISKPNASRNILRR